MTILAIWGIYNLLTIEKKALFFTGFFIAIFWFYWFALSLKYYDLNYLFLPLILGLALFYGFIFYLFALIDKISFRMLMLFAFLFFAPFGFDWLKLELIFINTYIGSTKLAFVLVLFFVYFLIKLKRFKILAFLPLFLAFDFGDGKFIDKTKAKIYMAQMNLSQEIKWDKKYLKMINENNLNEIFKAIENKYDLVVLPEIAFPLALNKNPELFNLLLELSEYIDIISGSLYVENNEIFNASYHFSKKNVKIAKKVVLVPFGEEIPLPKIFVDFINETFYGGAKDYSKAKKATDFEIMGEKYRNAICYEGTTDKIFEDLADTRYMIMISNNAWFVPSIQPTLQHLLLKYYSKKYGVTIFHIANGSENRIYRP